MRIISKGSTSLAVLAMLAVPAWSGVSAQQVNNAAVGNQINVYGSVPTDLSNLPEGPTIEGRIASRSPAGLKVSSDNGTVTPISLSAATEIKGSGGFLGTKTTKIAASSLLNGLPVTVETVHWEGGLVATSVKYKNKNMQTAAMIRDGTSQQFAEHGAAIDQNAAATEALRGRVANIDQYNIKGTTNVYFDTGKWNISPAAQGELCEAATQAEAMDNALLLVVGYTDSVGDYDYNQVLSEKRAGRVVNFLQQQCGWQPWRMLTPTGMADSDPAADNSTAAGKAQNRRVSVNILVSKAVDGEQDGFGG